MHQNERDRRIQTKIKLCYMTILKLKLNNDINNELKLFDYYLVVVFDVDLSLLLCMSSILFYVFVVSSVVNDVLCHVRHHGMVIC